MHKNKPLPLTWQNTGSDDASPHQRKKILDFLQFVPPTCNFLLAALVYQELVSPLKLGAFILIWSALAIFTWDSFQKQRMLALQDALRN